MTQSNCSSVQCSHFSQADWINSVPYAGKHWAFSVPTGCHTSRNWALTLNSGGCAPLSWASFRRLWMPWKSWRTARGMIPCSSSLTVTSKPVPMVYVFPEPVCRHGNINEQKSITHTNVINRIRNSTYYGFIFQQLMLQLLFPKRGILEWLISAINNTTLFFHNSMHCHILFHSLHWVMGSRYKQWQWVTYITFYFHTIQAMTEKTTFLVDYQPDSLTCYPFFPPFPQVCSMTGQTRI